MFGKLPRYSARHTAVSLGVVQGTSKHNQRHNAARYCAETFEYLGVIPARCPLRTPLCHLGAEGPKLVHVQSGLDLRASACPGRWRSRSGLLDRDIVARSATLARWPRSCSFSGARSCEQRQSEPKEARVRRVTPNAPIPANCPAPIQRHSSHSVCIAVVRAVRTDVEWDPECPPRSVT